jgi:hypothetical protein
MTPTRAQWLRLSPAMRQHAAKLIAQIAMLRACPEYRAWRAQKGDRA